MISRWFSYSPWRGIGACGLVAAVVGCFTLLAAGSIPLMAITIVVIFSVSSLLVADTPGFRGWEPRSSIGHVAKAYIRGYVSLREGVGRAVVRTILISAFLAMLALLALGIVLCVWQ